MNPTWPGSSSTRAPESSRGDDTCALTRFYSLSVAEGEPQGSPSSQIPWNPGETAPQNSLTCTGKLKERGTVGRCRAPLLYTHCTQCVSSTPRALVAWKLLSEPHRGTFTLFSCPRFPQQQDIVSLVASHMPQTPASNLNTQPESEGTPRHCVGRLLSASLSCQPREEAGQVTWQRYSPVFPL